MQFRLNIRGLKSNYLIMLLSYTLNMKKRAKMLCGTLEINSFPDIHTQIIIEIPVHGQDETI